VLPKIIKKEKRVGGERRGGAEGERLKSWNLKSPWPWCSGDTGAVFAALPKSVKKEKGKGGERRGEGEGERLKSWNLKSPWHWCSGDTGAVFAALPKRKGGRGEREEGRDKERDFRICKENAAAQCQLPILKRVCPQVSSEVGFVQRHSLCKCQSNAQT